MSVEIKKLDNNEVQLDIQVDSQKSSLEYEKACKKLAKRVNVPGFRAGKAPKNILEKHVGKESIQREVLESILPEIFAKTINENKFEIITEPYVVSYEFLNDNSFKAVAKFELKPEVKLCEYKNLEIEIEEFKQAENALQKELDGLAERYCELKTIEGRKTLATDIVNIDFEGSIDGELIKGGAAKNYVLNLAQSTFIPGFAEQLVDKNTKEEFTINVKFPDEYHDDKIKGKNAEFKVTINEIKEKILPAIDDELAKKVGAFKSLEELKNDIQKYLDNTTKAENEKRAALKIVEKLNDSIEISIHEAMVSRESQALLTEFQQRVEAQGGNWDEVVAQEGHEKIWEQLQTEAKNRIKNSLIISKIAETENIQIENKDLEEKIEEIAKIYNTNKLVILEEIKKNPNIISSLSQQIMSQKVTQFLINSANIKYT